MPKSIFVTRKIPEVGIKMLEEKGFEVKVWQGNGVPSQNDLLESLHTGKYDAVLCLLTDRIDSKVFDAAPSIKLYANYTVGFDNVDIAEAKKRGITVTNTSGNYSHVIAEHAMALILGLVMRLLEADSFVREGKYKGWEPMLFMRNDLKGKTLGIVGAGNIGNKVASMACKGFGMKIIYYDIAQNKNIENECGAIFYESLDELLKEADVVSLHVPLLDSTQHLINGERLSLMKPSSCLVNTSRGAVIDEQALLEALEKGVIKGAGLDVFEFEPEVTSGLKKLQNVILTPHIASSSVEARNEMAVIAAQNIIDFFEGKVPKNIINP